MVQAIVNGRFVLDKEIREGSMLIRGGTIQEITSPSGKIPGKATVYDAAHGYVLPGMIDIHTHGCMGHDVMDGDPEGIRKISAFLASRGVTAFCPTTMSMPLEAIEKAIHSVVECRRQGVSGASIIGVHLEGPFISPRYKGAQKRENILKPMAPWVLERKEAIVLVTYAPEMDEGGDFCSALAREGIRLSIGHTGGTYQDVLRAVEWGASSASHLFNAMSPMHHREPGVVGGVFTTPLYAELIADGVHVHPALFELVLRIKGRDRVILISDSMGATGLGEGEYSLGGQKVLVSNGEARLEDGTLAGSTLTLDRAFRNVLYHGGVSLPDMARLTSTNPARLLGLSRKGRLAPGMDADITFLDSSFEVQRTLVGGREVFSRERKEKAK